MGDIAELKGLIFVVCFLGLLVLLLGLMPYQFYVAGQQTEIFIPDEWEGIDLQAFKETWNETSIYLHFEDFAIGGRNLRFDSDCFTDYMMLLQRYGLGLLWLEGGTWFNRRGVIVSQAMPITNHQAINAYDLNTDYSEFASIEFTIKFSQNSPFQVQAFLTFNETVYNNPTTAWQNDNLSILLGIDFDNINTSYNAWDLIAMLLFFNMPNTHWIINAIIAIPIWVVVAYLAYVLVIKVIPLIAGG